MINVIQWWKIHTGNKETGQSMSARESYSVMHFLIKEENKIMCFFGVAYQGKDIVFRFIIEYSSLRDFGP